MGQLSDSILRGADVIDHLQTMEMGDRSTYMNASEAMSCLRKQWYSKNDAEKDGKEDWGYARRGKAAERYIIEALTAANVPLKYVGDDQIKLVDEDTKIAATPDGMAWAPALGWEQEGWVAVEFKSIDPRTNLHNLPKAGHVKQVQIAAQLLSEKHDIVGAKLIYIDASNYNKLHEYDVPLNPAVLEQLAGRARRVLDADEAARLPREGTLSFRKQDCKMCPFTKVCGVDGVEVATEAPTSSSFTAMRTKYISAKMDEEEARGRKATAAEEIKSELARTGQTSMQVDEGFVSLKTRSGTINYKKVVEDHVGDDVDLDTYRGSPSEILTVK